MCYVGERKRGPCNKGRRSTTCPQWQFYTPDLGKQQLEKACCQQSTSCVKNVNTTFLGMGHSSCVWLGSDREGFNWINIVCVAPVCNFFLFNEEIKFELIFACVGLFSHSQIVYKIKICHSCVHIP